MPYLTVILFSIALVLSAVNAALFVWLKIRFDRKIAALNGKISGLDLDYQEAQKAANKVNDFGDALANIFDYDPIRAMQRSREKGDS